MTHQELVANLRSSHFNKKKTLGQHFLLEESDIERIAEAANVSGGACVLEIGPGPGTLTLALAKRAKTVLCVEIDRSLEPLLSALCAAHPNVRVVYGDVQKLDLGTLTREAFGGDRFDVVANLPYYITSPVVMQLLAKGLPVDALTLTIQREAAERLLAEPGQKNYVAATVYARYFARASILFDIPASAFTPPPHVTSSVVRLDVRPAPFPVASESVYFSVVRAAFLSRRKTLRNNLQAVFALTREDADLVLASAGCAPDARGDALSPEALARVAVALAHIIENAG